MDNTPGPPLFLDCRWDEDSCHGEWLFFYSPLWLWFLFFPPPPFSPYPTVISPLASQLGKQPLIVLICYFLLFTFYIFVLCRQLLLFLTWICREQPGPALWVRSRISAWQPMSNLKKKLKSFSTECSVCLSANRICTGILNTSSSTFEKILALSAWESSYSLPSRTRTPALKLPGKKP